MPLRSRKFFTSLVLGVVLFNSCGDADYSTNDKSTLAEVKESWKHQIEMAQGVPGIGFRGLAVVDTSVIWVSGQRGVWGKTTDNGVTWMFDSIATAKELDFRSVYAFDANLAFLLTAGTPALLYKTEDGGESWNKVYENLHEKVFFDGLKFWDKKRGLAFSDPIDGKLFIIKTGDGGETWQKINTTKIPPSLKNEAGFAASGTGIWLGDGGTAFIGLGGDKARIFKSTNYGEDWHAFETPVQSGSGSKGIYSLDMLDGKVGIAVGGDYTMPQANNNVAYTENGGKTWALAQTKVEYKECVKFLTDLCKSCVVAVGPAGIDVSEDLGDHWTKIDSISGFHTIGFSADQLNRNLVGWMTGSEGKIAKIIFLKN